MTITKEQLRAEIMQEVKVPTLTPKEAFEAGKSGDLSGYNAAGNACCRAIVKFAERYPDKWAIIQKMYRDYMAFRSGKYASTDEVQNAAIKLFLDNSIERIKSYPKSEFGPAWKYDRLEKPGWWDVETALSQLGQNILGTVYDYLDSIADEELKKVQDEIVPTGFMWSWAVNTATWLLDEVV